MLHNQILNHLFTMRTVVYGYINLKVKTKKIRERVLLFIYWIGDKVDV